jgi:hypothetical protein
VWQFAQGTASSDRQTFLTILNPNQSSDAGVTATFFDSKGKPIGSKTIFVNALRRGNIKLNEVLPTASVAMLLSSNVPVVVERPLYVGPSNLDQSSSGFVVLGRNGGGRSWIFPGGSLANGNQNDYYFYNTGVTENTVAGTFYTGGHQIVHSIALAPNSTGHLNAQSVSGLGNIPYGVQFSSKNGQVFVVEQRITAPSAHEIDGTQGIAE